MEKELSVVTYIRANGLDKTILDFKLKFRDYGHKVLIKYDQIESDMNLEEVQDCRGLILEKGTWKVMCLSFRKFFNNQEGNAATIDWDTATILEKLDGSMIQVYYDWVVDRWFAATTGTGEGEGEVNNKLGLTFDDLFWNTLNEKYTMFKDLWYKLFNRDHCFVFELTTPYNIVVKPHGESSVALLASRNVKTLQEVNYNGLLTLGSTFDLPVVKSYDFNKGNFGHILRTFETMLWDEEGYVVVDGNFNRVKCKNPAYVAAHHLKSKTAAHHILTIVKTNEIEEYGATFPDRKDEIDKLKESYDTLVMNLSNIWETLQEHKPKNITPKEQKKFAMKVFELAGKDNLVKSFSGLFFALKDGKATSVKEYMHEYDNKRLYEIL